MRYFADSPTNSGFHRFARVAELADALDLGHGASRRHPAAPVDFEKRGSLRFWRQEASKARSAKYLFPAGVMGSALPIRPTTLVGERYDDEGTKEAF